MSPLNWSKGTFSGHKQIRKKKSSFQSSWASKLDWRGTTGTVRSKPCFLHFCEIKDKGTGSLQRNVETFYSNIVFKAKTWLVFFMFYNLNVLWMTQYRKLKSLLAMRLFFPSLSMCTPIPSPVWSYKGHFKFSTLLPACLRPPAAVWRVFAVELSIKTLLLDSDKRKKYIFFWMLPNCGT